MKDEEDERRKTKDRYAGVHLPLDTAGELFGGSGAT
jgi:hypothetical protein